MKRGLFRDEVIKLRIWRLRKNKRDRKNKRVKERLVKSSSNRREEKQRKKDIKQTAKGQSR